MCDCVHRSLTSVRLVAAPSATPTQAHCANMLKQSTVQTSTQTRNTRESIAVTEGAVGKWTAEVICTAD